MYVGSCSGVFYSLDAATGAVSWRYDTSQGGAAAQFHGDALVTPELVVVGSDGRPSGSLYAFERDGGGLRWRHDFPGGVAVDVHRHGRRVLATSMAGDVVAVDLASGEIAWRSEAGAEVSGRPVDPALDGDRYYVAWPPGYLDAYDAVTGSRLWRTELPSRPNTSVAALGDDLVVGTLDGRLLRYDRASGEPRAQLRVGSMLYGELVPAGGGLLTLAAPEAGSEARGHAVVCVEPDLSGERWRHETGAAGEIGTFEPLVVDDEVVAGTEGKLFALAVGDGSVRWSVPVPGLPRGLGASEATLFVGTLSGHVLALPWQRSGETPPR